MSHNGLFFTFLSVVRTAAPKAFRPFSAAAAPSADVVIPELVSTLEWVLDSPPNVHQFDEPPVSATFKSLCERLIHAWEVIPLFGLLAVYLCLIFYRSYC